VAIRLRLALFFGLLGAVLALCRNGAPGSDIGELALALGAASSGHVRPSDVKWTAPGGAIGDAIFGRSVVFLSSVQPNGPRDVWRARIRVSPEGHLVSIESASNLTGTPLGDDHALVVSGARAAYATRAYGQEQSASALDLGGEGDQNGAQTFADRLMAWVTNLQQTGSGDGVGRIDVGFERPADRIGLALDQKKLAIDLGDGPKVESIALDLERGELLGAKIGAHADPARHLPKRFVFWAVDTVRAVSWIGPAPIAWLEEKAFAVRDTLKRTFHRNAGDEDTLATTPVAPPRVLDAALGADADAVWPPPNIPSIWKQSEKGEGVWGNPTQKWMRKMPGVTGAPPFFVETFVRPDDQRPDSRVILVAMDMRQLELGMEAGTEDPKPLLGTHGPGRLPRDPQVLGRVVAAFNGAFKTEHGNYGMMVNKKVLLPPVPQAATVVSLADGRTVFGNWGNTDDIGGLEGIADDDILSFRQNLDPLLDEGRVNPTHRGLWGYTLPGSGTQTERSGVCVTASGQMIYAWGDDVSATAVGKAMQSAGCTYGLHLDMNPHHTGFLFTTIRDLKSHDYNSEALTPLMEMSTDRYLNYAPKDFFYVMVRDPIPKLGGFAWTADGGTQPAPAWLPSIWSAKEGPIDLAMIDSARTRFRLRAGTSEPDPKTGSQPSYDLGEADATRVLFSMTMGTALEKRPRALVTAGKQTFPKLETASAILFVSPEGKVSLESSMPAISPEADAAELPLVADDGKVLPIARIAGPPRSRSVLGIGPRGEVLVAHGNLGSDAPLADALVRAGCRRVVVLDRGRDATASTLRAGTSTPPVAHSAETTLYAIAASMPPRAFRFRAAKR
jgi:hypothetical protein